ncbi:sister chromatid cohesion protein PDS5 homolog C-like isoform X1 [Euphorbia lathyris]|uniref:sister chromatid cohesion protein PDS5 homolog C-like isoform X1 n=1 Tax=Euphorbia lathyris TaxID=212925 RepID=UPI00331401AF
MASSDKELDQQLMEAGNKLLQLPSALDVLLPLLDQIENCLSKVEQSPTKTMQNALAPSLKALVSDHLFKHTDVDVKAAVASCISEITRITAPEAPYDDDKMKDVFQLIVSSFENLSDKSSRSYSKRTSILDTVAKVRSCVVMLDLECDGLIIEMFQHFLSAIRDYHPENVFTAMETIMALVLEESEDISTELLSPLLATLKKDNEEVLPIARKLGEKVLESCASKVRPYLQHAVKSSGVSLDDYSDVVASICQELSGSVEQNDALTADENKIEESKPVEASSDEAAQAGKEIAAEAGSPKLAQPTNDKSPKSVVSNGVAQTCEDESLADSSSLKKQDDSTHADQSKSVDTSSNADPSSLDAEKLVRDESKREEASKKGRKANSSTKSPEPSESSHIDTEKCVQKPLDDKAVGKDVLSSSHEETVVEAAVSSENKKGAGTSQPSSPKALEGESVTVASPLESENLPKAVLSKKESLIKDSEPSADDVSRKTCEVVSDSEAKINKRSKKETLIKDSEPSAEDVSRKTSEVASDSEAKVNKRSKKESSVKDSEPSAEDVSRKTSEGVSDSEAKVNKPSKKESSVKESEPSAEDVSRKTNEGVSDSEAKVTKRSKKETKASEPSAEDVKTPERISDLEAKLNKRSKKESSVKASDGVSDSEAKVNKRSKKEGSVKDSKPSAGDVSRKTSEATNDSEAKLNKRSKKETLIKDSEPSADDVSRKTPEGISGSEAKLNKRSKKGSLMKDSETSADDVSRKTSEAISDSEAKLNKRSSRKAPSKKSNEEKTPKTDASKKEGGATSESETKPLKKPSKKVDVSSNNGDGSSFTPVENKKQRSRGKSVPEKNVIKDSTKDDDEKVSSPKSAAKTKDVHQLETPKTDNKRKRAAGNEKGSETLDYDPDELVGKRVKVYWPKDKEYYIGTIDSFNASNKKHKVLYDDGDQEILNLKREKWAFIQDDDVMQDEIEADVPPSPDAPPETPPPKKKAKTNVDQSAKHGKPESVKGGGASSSKSKSAVTKSARKSKEAGKTDGKSADDSKAVKKVENENVGKAVKKVENENVGKTKDNTNKSGSKSAEVSKSSSKSKNEDISTSKSSKPKEDGTKMPKTSKQEVTKTAKPKQDSPNIASIAKSSGKTSKSSGKSSVNNGAGKLKSGSSSKPKEPVVDDDSTDSDKPPETPKVKSVSSSKGQGSEGKSGKKRRRG